MRCRGLLALGLIVAVTAATAETRLLCDFETDADLKVWKTNQARLERITTSTLQGRAALAVTFLPGEFPGVSLLGKTALLQGWERFDSLRFEVFNPTNRPVPFTIRIDDAQSHNFESRFNDEFVLRPGVNRLEYPLHRLPTEDGRRAIDPASIVRLMLFTGKRSEPLTLWIDHVRLETRSSAAPPAGVHAFDFGTKHSLVMPGFTPVRASDLYTPERGWGWTSPGPRTERDRGSPDSLCGDFVTGARDAAFVESFAVDVRNGDYTVTVCGQHLAGEAAWLPARSYQIRAEGLYKAGRDITAEVFCSDQILFRGLNRDWWPKQDVWRDLVQPAYPEFTFPVTVTDGQLNLDFENTAVYWLSIVPEGVTYSVESARRREFQERHYYLTPYRPVPNPEQIIVHAAKDQTVTVFLNASRTPTMTGLQKVDITLRAVSLRLRRTSRGIYHVAPADLADVTNRPHATRFALTLRSDQPGKHVGFVADVAIEFHVWPFALPRPEELPLTYGWFYGGSDDYVDLFPEKRAAARARRAEELRDMAAHGFNSVSVPAPRMYGGQLNLKPVAEFLSAARAAGLVTRHRTLVNTLYAARDLARHLQAPEFSAAFLPSFQAALRQMDDWARTNQYPILAYVVDEPREQARNPWNRNFADTQRFVNLAQEAHLPAVVTLLRDQSFGKNYVPLVDQLDVVATKPSREAQGIIAAARARKKELWFYNGGMNRLSFGFYPWAQGATGRWEWHYQSWLQAYDPFAPGEGIGAVRPGPNGPMPTEAYERVRAGIDDYRFIVLLERLIQRQPGGRTEQARRLLAGIRGKMPQFLWSPDQQVSEETLDAWRGEIAAAIAALAAEAK